MNRILYIVTTIVSCLYPEINYGIPSNSFFLSDISLSRTDSQSIQSLERAFDKSTYKQPLSYSESLQTIVIDPGHGGKDNGTSGKLSKEKDIALQVSKKIGKLIQEEYPEINVIYTRETDVFIPLHERATIANSNNADLFVSIHCNYVPAKSHVHGTETYVMGLHRADDNLDIAMRENSAILFEDNYQENYGDFDINSPENYIIQSMYQYAHLEHSITFANYLEHQFVKASSRRSRGVKQAGFLVLRETTMPSVLVELGFLSNPQEEKYLISDEGQNDIAQRFLIALRNYIEFQNSSIAEQAHKAHKIAEAVELNVEKTDTQDNTEAGTYAIQLFATSTQIPASHKIYREFKDIEVIEVNGIYKYYCGSFKERTSAKDRLTSVHTFGYEDAFITKLPQ